MRRSSFLALVCSGAMAATLVAAAPSQARPAHHDHDPVVVADNLAGPLTLAVGPARRLYVTQSFAGQLTRLDRHGASSTVAELGTADGELVGVSLGRGGVYYVETDSIAGTSHVNKVDRRGRVRTVSDDFFAYEAAHNPDGAQRYGFTGLDPYCAGELAEFEQGFPPGELPPLSEYTGIVESHAYQTAVGRHGEIYVADAAANAILRVDRRSGQISTVAVLPPPEPVTITQDIIDQMLPPGAPACLLGQSFVAEPVPTDVEVGRDGNLYVSTLGGGLGEALPLSSVYRVSPRSGSLTWLAGGMHGVTGLALLGRDVVVAQMFGGEVSVVHHGSRTAQTLFEVDGPADVEVRGRTVYATTVDMETGAGSVVRYRTC